MLWTAGCATDDAPVVPPQADETVTVGFSVQARLEQQSGMEPMTRATAWEEWFDNEYRVLVLKKIESKWIVDTLLRPLLDASKGKWSMDMKIGAALPENSFSAALRPGAYRAVAVLNPAHGQWNTALVPGTVVADDDNPSAPVPPLMTYAVSTHPANSGYRQLNREVFVAVADFTVPKSSDLHSDGMPSVTLSAERRVGKFRMLLKDKPSPREGLTFERTAHTGNFVFTSKGRPLPDGIDALGAMYYDPQAPLQQLEWRISTIGDFHPSGPYAYHMSQPNSTVYSPFLFADPREGELPVEISVVVIAGASGGFTYLANQVFDRMLAASKVIGIVFETTDAIREESSQRLVEVVEARDDEGNLEDATRLFDPFYEWNISY